MRTAFIVILLLAQSFLCHAQPAQDFQPQEFAIGKPDFDGFHIVGYVPEFLRLSLDFSQDNKAWLAGFYPSVSAVKDKNPSVPALEFKIGSGASIEFGQAVIISNIERTYIVTVFSAHGGRLRSSSAKGENVSIGYSLSLDGQTARAENGVFRFIRSGKSREGGIHLGVGIILDEVTLPLAHEMYTDELSFSIATE